MFNRIFRRVFALLIVVSASGVLPLNVNIKVASAAPPSNDNIANASDLTSVVSPFIATASNIEASLEQGEDQIVSSSDYYYWSNFTNSLWYKITPNQGAIEFTTSSPNTTVDTILAVFTFSAPASFGTPTLRGINDDIIIEQVQNPSRQSKVGFIADGISTYYIAVGGFGESSGNITLSWRYPSQVTNNSIENPISIATGNTLVNQNNYLSDTTLAENEFILDSGYSTSWDNSVWFSAQLVPGSWGIRLENFVGAKIIVLSDNDFSAGSLVALSENVFGFEVEVSTTYYIGIGGTTTEQSFDIALSSIVRPSTVVSPQFSFGPTTTISWSPPDNYDSDIHSYSVWLLNGDRVRTCDTPSLMSCTFSRLDSGTWTVSIAAYETRHNYFGTTYLQTFELSNLSNDYFVSAISLLIDAGQIDDYLDYSTLESNEPTHQTPQTSSSVWYSFAPTTTGTSTFSVAETNFENSGDIAPILAVYTGDQLTNLQRVATSARSVSWESRASQRYYVAISSTENYADRGSEDQRFKFRLTWSHVAAPAPIIEPPSNTPAAPSTPKITTVKVKNNATLASILKKAKIKPPKNSKVTYKIASASKKLCSISSSKMKFKKKGSCSLTVKVKPKKGATTTHQLSVNF